MKPFFEALSDGFFHITDITDPALLTSLRSEGIRVDDEGYYTFSPVDHKEFELRIEPFGEEGCYLIAFYRSGVALTQKLVVWTHDKKP